MKGEQFLSLRQIYYLPNDNVRGTILQVSANIFAEIDH